jgi:hypothetical protein
MRVFGILSLAVFWRNPDPNFCGHPLAMLIKKMSVNLSNQDPAVFVPQPLGNRHEIDAGHDAK